MAQDRERSWYFAHGSAAQRYDAGRPRFHHLLLPTIRTLIGGCQRDLALDVGCGTGHSTIILPDLAKRVIGCDIAPEMLALAPQHEAITWVEAPAERLPANDRSVDLITVTMAFHWFDQRRFLTEARRVLRDDGWLLLISNGFRSEMVGNPAFTTWCREVLYRRYPTPARNASTLTAADLRFASMSLISDQTFSIELPFTQSELTAYVLTQSNFIARIETGDEAIEDVTAWIEAGLAPFFDYQEERFVFGGAIRAIQPDIPEATAQDA